MVRHDPDDPYLVVAADKGTATFSDIANEISVQQRVLDAATRSRPAARPATTTRSMGITAKGAWELVKKRFRDLGCDTQTQEFTVVGVGDMSGDVFGNGMLLSEHIRLVAAFDHRHIFIDPTPDAAASYAERRRLFDLPRSSWADYDAGPHLRRAAGSSRGRSKSVPAVAAGARRAGPGRHRRGADAGRADEGDPQGAGRPVLERRHRHVRQGHRRVARRRRRQGQRRDPHQRPRPARQRGR